MMGVWVLEHKRKHTNVCSITLNFLEKEATDTVCFDNLEDGLPLV